MSKMKNLNNSYSILSTHLKNKLIIEYLNEVFPNPKCELEYNDLFELLIAVMLSSQTLDRRVNEVTKVLFSKYPTVNDLYTADINDLENLLKPLGLAKTKASNIKNICNDLIKNYNGEVPTSFNDLTSLKGVGEKTAQVVMIEGLNQKAFPVDTHVLRVSKRLGLVEENINATSASKKLKGIFPDDLWNKLHQQMVLFGRYHCLAKKPKCDNCKLNQICKYLKNDKE